MGKTKDAPAAPAAPPVKADGVKAEADKDTGKPRGGASRMNVLAEAAAAPPGVAAPPEPPAAPAPAPAAAAAPGGQSMLPEVDILVNLQRNGNGSASAPAAVQAPNPAANTVAPPPPSAAGSKKPKAPTPAKAPGAKAGTPGTIAAPIKLGQVGGGTTRKRRLVATSAEEEEKLETKRQKNREAAQKCRKKQKDQINHLESECAKQTQLNESVRAKVALMQAELIKQQKALASGTATVAAFPHLQKA